MFCKLDKAHFRYIICLVHDSAFLKNDIISLVAHLAPKDSTMHTKKRFDRIIILSALKLPSCGLVVFINIIT